jgi:hypothetical protein
MSAAAALNTLLLIRDQLYGDMQHALRYLGTMPAPTGLVVAAAAAAAAAVTTSPLGLLLIPQTSGPEQNRNTSQQG